MVCFKQTSRVQGITQNMHEYQLSEPNCQQFLDISCYLICQNQIVIEIET